MPVTPLALVALIVLVLALVGWFVAGSPLPRRTVEKFARRQQLDLTESNASLVVSALLITHRWRRAGLVLGLLVGLVWSLRSGGPTLSFLAGLLGWFVGAVIAEWRISGLEQAGPRRSAALAPRGLTRYLTPGVRLIAAAVVLVLAGVAGTAAVRAGLTGSWVGWVLYAVVLVVALVLTGRTIVERPSGFVDADIRDADDALRCHGLTVLVGAGIATAYPALSGLAVLAAYPGGVPMSAEPAWTLLIFVGCLVVGLFVAVWSSSARAGRRAGAAAPTQGQATTEREPA